MRITSALFFILMAQYLSRRVLYDYGSWGGDASCERGPIGVTVFEYTIIITRFVLIKFFFISTESLRNYAGIWNFVKRGRCRIVGRHFNATNSFDKTNVSCVRRRCAWNNYAVVLLTVIRVQKCKTPAV